jgi:hypothetical protein
VGAHHEGVVVKEVARVARVILLIAVHGLGRGRGLGRRGLASSLGRSGLASSLGRSGLASGLGRSGLASGLGRSGMRRIIKGGTQAILLLLLLLLPLLLHIKLVPKVIGLNLARLTLLALAHKCSLMNLLYLFL